MSETSNLSGTINSCTRDDYKAFQERKDFYANRVEVLPLEGDELINKTTLIKNMLIDSKLAIEELYNTNKNKNVYDSLINVEHLLNTLKHM